VHVGGAIGLAGDDLGVEGARGFGKRGADRKFFPGFDEATPGLTGVSFGGTEQEALDLAARGATGAEAGGEDGGVVAKQRVAGAQEAGQIGEGVMRNAAGGAVDDEQTGLVTPCGGGLRDEVFGQGIIEKLGVERRHGGKMRLALAGVASFFRSSRRGSCAISKAPT
jgi:hypothetical protein